MVREGFPARQQADSRSLAVLPVAGEHSRVAKRYRAVGDCLRQRRIRRRRELAVRLSHVESRLGLSSTLAVHEKAIIEDALRQAQSRLGSFCINAAFLTSVTDSAGDPQTGGFESAFSGSG